MYIPRKTLLEQAATDPQQSLSYLAEPSRENMARFMAEEIIAQIEADHPDVALDLACLTENIFSQKELDANLYQSLIEKYRGDAVKYRLLVSNYVRIGHFIEVSGHLERESLFDIYRRRRDNRLANFDPQNDVPPVIDEEDIVPGGIERVLFETNSQDGGRSYVFATVSQAIDYFNKPVFAPILTTHPTFVDTLAAQQKLRELHDAWREILSDRKSFSDHGFARVQKIVKEFRETELTPVSVDENGKTSIRNFTSREEVDLKLDTLTQMWNGLTGVYKTFDDALSRRFGGDYSITERERLHVHLEPISWIHYDKDGNDNVKAEHSLHATVRQRLLALQLHSQKLKQLGLSLNYKDTSISWVSLLDEAVKTFSEIDQFMEQRKNGGIDLPLKQSEFDAILDQLKQPFGVIAGESKPQDFEKLVEALEKDVVKARSVIDFSDPGQAPHYNTLLSYGRQIRSFGFRLAYAEYRETSDEYVRVIATLLKTNPFTGEVFKYDDKNFTPEQRTAFLNRLISEKPQALREAAADFLSKIESTDALRHYADNAPEVITYHTLKRAQLAAAQPGMFRDTVIAECKNASSVMDALALQHMFQTPNGGHADMHLTPLLEELEKLSKAPEMLMQLLHQKAYRDQLVRLSGGDLAKLRIKLQIAHSDNVRRGGTPAARATIHDVHDALQLVLKEHRNEIIALFAVDGHDTSHLHIEVEASQGGSNSDALRNGKKAMTATINAFKLFNYFKSTFQGNDLFGFLGFATSFKRTLARFFTHSAKELAHRDEHGANDNIQPTPLRAAVITALNATEKDYAGKHFNDDGNQIGHLFAHPLVNYLLYGTIFNRGTRAAIRGGKQKTTIYADPKLGTVPIETDKVRTIGFSNVLRDANLLGTWFGIEHFSRRFTQALADNPEAVRELNAKRAREGDDKAYKLGDDPSTLFPYLYRNDAAFRDVIDKVAYGIAESDIPKLQRRLNHARDHFGIPITPEINAYVQNLRLEYDKAAHMVLSAFGAETNTIDPDRLWDNDAYLEKLRQRVIDKALPHLKETLSVKQRFSSFLEEVRDDVIQQSWKAGKKDLNDDDLLLLSDIASGTLLARHGRDFTADDPHFARSLSKYKLAQLAA